LSTLCAHTSYPRSLSRAPVPAATPFFFFTDPAPTEIYTLSLHDALPISPAWQRAHDGREVVGTCRQPGCQGKLHTVPTHKEGRIDRKSTRLNSSHVKISYAVFCLKKKKKKHNTHQRHTQRDRYDERTTTT